MHMNTTVQKDIQLDQEEREILDAVERGEFVSVPNVEEVHKQHQAYARAALTNLKKKNINIRISEHDLVRLKARAMEEGLPYQTYIASVLHKSLVR